MVQLIPLGNLAPPIIGWVCVVCSVSSWDSVLLGCAPALGLALKGRDICPPRACSLGQTSEPNGEGRQGQPDKESNYLRNQLEAPQSSRMGVQSQATGLMRRKTPGEDCIELTAM